MCTDHLGPESNPDSDLVGMGGGPESDFLTCGHLGDAVAADHGLSIEF